MAALDELQKIDRGRTDTHIAVLMLDEGLNTHYQRIARRFRENNMNVEILLEKRKLNSQFKTAEKKGIPLALICGEDEVAAGTVNLKDLRNRESYDALSPEAAVKKAAELLSTGGTVL